MVLLFTVIAALGYMGDWEPCES